jgi:hypothetical protein
LGPDSPRTRRRSASGWQLDDLEGWIVIGFAAAFAALLILLESRPNTFFNDEVAIFQRLGEGIDARSVLEPHNGHLILPAHLVYAALFSWVGPSYTAFRVVGVIVLVACGALVFALAKRRVGVTVALVPAILVLVLGSAWEAILWPLTMLTFGLAVAFGLAALAALDREDTRGDVAACVLAALAVVSHSTGLAFLVGVAVAVLVRGPAWRRAWVVGVPLAIYVAWWIWALQFDEGLAHLGNLLIVPQFMADSLAAVSAAVTGLGLDLGSGPVSLTVSPSWGYVIAPLAAVALVLRLARGRIPRFVWAVLAVLLAYWLELALGFAPEGRTPFESRYLFAGAVLVLLVAAGALHGLRIPRWATAAIVAVGLVGVLTNIKQIDNAERYFSDYSPRARTALGALEVARGAVAPNYRPAADARLKNAIPPHLPVEAGPYLEGVDRFGSYAFSADELLQQDPALREAADRVLAGAERLSLRPASGPPAGTCEASSGRPAAVLQLRPGQVSLQAGRSATVRLGRFATGYPVDLGDLTPGRRVVLSIPQDAEARPWRLEIGSVPGLRVCVSAAG